MAISLANMTSPVTSRDAEFLVFQNGIQIAHILIDARDTISIPTPQAFEIKAFSTMGEFEINSNSVDLEGWSAAVTAQVTEEAGFNDFAIVAADGPQLETLTFENRWENPVAFVVKQAKTDSPWQMVVTVDPSGSREISTAQQWSVYAIINGITTPTVEVTDPDPMLELFLRDGNFELVG